MFTSLLNVTYSFEAEKIFGCVLHNTITNILKANFWKWREQTKVRLKLMVITQPVIDTFHSNLHQCNSIQKGLSIHTENSILMKIP